jgi:hypothetical protein
MKTSPHGAPICTGAGVAAARKKIEDAFAVVRTDVRTSGPSVGPQPLLPLRDTAQPILRAAVQSHKDAVVDRRGVHHISVPKNSAEQLIAEAVKLIGEKR